jgi:hypothetical protein
VRATFESILGVIGKTTLQTDLQFANFEMSNLLSSARITLLENSETKPSESGQNDAEGQGDPESNVTLHPVRQNFGQITTEERSNRQRKTNWDSSSNLEFTPLQDNNSASLNRLCVFMHLTFIAERKGRVSYSCLAAGNSSKREGSTK